jgi:hypothetical protein
VNQLFHEIRGAINFFKSPYKGTTCSGFALIGTLSKVRVRTRKRPMLCSTRLFCV